MKRDGHAYDMTRIVVELMPIERVKVAIPYQGQGPTDHKPVTMVYTKYSLTIYLRVKNFLLEHTY